MSDAAEPDSETPAATRKSAQLPDTPAERPAPWSRPIGRCAFLGAGMALYFSSVLVVSLLGNLRAVRRSVVEVQNFDVDNVVWLKGGPHRARTQTPAPPQGRFNAGQKLNTAISAGLLVVLSFTGAFLWLGERDTSLRFSGSVPMHDFAPLIIVVLVAGHTYLALINPSTRHALRGMVFGDVDRIWAKHHHEKWVEETDADAR